jgi:kinetochore protein Spc24
LRDTVPTLSPDDELGDLAAAETLILAREAEREVVLNKLQAEIRRKHPL